MAPERSPPSIARRLRDALGFAWDTLRRAWAATAADNAFFLAGGIAFNILLAVVPFALLLVSGLTYVLGLSPDASAGEIRVLLDRFLPPHSEAAGSAVHGLIDEAIRTRGAAGIYGALIYVWFSTRLFGSLRAVLSLVFDRESDRGIFWGKWYDVRLTLYSTILMVAYVGLSLYLAVARSRGVSLLVELGVREDVMGRLEYAVGRLIAFAFVAALFFALYKILPKHRISSRQALIGALCSSVLFEIARNVWTAITASFDPGSLYSGTLYAVVSVVFWVYYAALIFILGAEVSQAGALARRARSEGAGAPTA